MTRFLRLLLTLLLAVAFAWGLSAFGATQTNQLYRLFLLLTIPALGAVWGLWGGRQINMQQMVLLCLGGFLFINIAFRGPVTGNGYVLLALGWIGLALAHTISGLSLRAARLVVFFLVLVGVYEAFYGLAQSLAGLDYIGSYFRGLGNIATGTLFNRNHFAGLLNMTTPLALGAVFAGFVSIDRTYSENLARGWILIVGCALMGLATVLSQSRGGTASLLASLLLMALLLASKRHAQRYSRALMAIPFAMLILAVTLGATIGLEGLLSSFGQSESSLAGRGIVYRDTVRLLADHPILGVGPGMYQWRFRPYQTIDDQVWYDYAHNDYLQTATEWGLPVALLFWGFVAWRFRKSIQIFLFAPNPWKAGIGLGCAVAIFSILLHSLVDFNLYIPVNWMVFCSILGLSMSVEQLEPEPLDI